METYTPRGLKIRIPVQYSFSLMSRLFPTVTPFTVLKTTEGIDLLSNLLAVIATIIIIFKFPNESLIYKAIGILAAYYIGYLMQITGIFFIPYIIRLSELYSYINGFGIVTVILGICGYFKMGLSDTIIIIILLFVPHITDWIIDMARAIWCKAKDRPYLTMSELDFLNAYKMHAAAIGANVDTFVSEEEMQSGEWKKPYAWLQINWPQITNKMAM